MSELKNGTNPTDIGYILSVDDIVWPVVKLREPIYKDCLDYLLAMSEKNLKDPHNACFHLCTILGTLANSSELSSKTTTAMLLLGDKISDCIHPYVNLTSWLRYNNLDKKDFPPDHELRVTTRQLILRIRWIHVLLEYNFPTN